MKVLDSIWEISVNESPESVELVRQERIIPLMDRLPVPEDILYMHTFDEIEVYGGVQRSI